ncbi:MAG: PQQ-binding-like beta-propeller repeat protein, partial [Armatimonadetes bacterium]|nr:PQQ-binding-like beta-propeller repeat protein [Armatimonadota bacterium]
TGDLVEVGLSEEFAVFKSLIENFTMPVRTVPGNHETKWSNWGKLGPKKFLGDEPFYSFDHGGIHFVGLDSTLWLEHYGLIDQSQLAWLKADLDKAGRETPVVIFYHHMPGFLGGEQELLRLIRPYDVRLILVGHGHTFKTWMRNGLSIQECKGAMNDKGGYRILEVSGDEIRSYTKLVGEEKKPDGAISLSPVANQVVLIKPLNGVHLGDKVLVRAMVMKPMTKVEFGIDGEYQPVTPDATGICELDMSFSGVPGWRSVTVRATDAAGMEWSDSASVRIGPHEKEAWRLKVSGAVERPATALGDRLYFGCWGGDVYCLDARTGREVWRHNVGSDVISRLAVEGGLAYLGAADGRVFALDSSTGEQVWEYRTEGPVLGSPALGEGKVFIGSGDCAFYALDAKSGALCWRYPMKRMSQTVPIYMNGAVYFGAWDNYFHALRASDGKELWGFKTGATLYYSPANSDPATDGKRIVVTSYPGKGADPDIYCFNAKTGDLEWKRRNPGGKSICIFNSPFVSGDRFYIADIGGGLYCMRMADGKEIWRSKIGQTCYDNWPVVADGKVYVSGLRGNLVRFDAATGIREWAYSTGDGYLLASPTVWRDLVIIPSTDGAVTAIRR